MNLEKAEAIAKGATRKLEGLEQARAGQAGNAEEKHLERRELVTKIVSLEAEANSLKVLLADREQDDQKPVLDQIQVEKGYEKALASALGDDLTAPLENEEQNVFKRYWSRILPKKTGPGLPAGAEPLANFVKAPAELAAVLRQVGVVDKEDIAEKLRGSLMHGQILTTKNGGLWRWDGFVVQGEVSNQSSVRLTQMARLREVLDELTNLNRAKEESDLIAKKKVLAAEEYKKNINKLRAKNIDFQKKRQKSSNEILNLKNQARTKMLVAINPILTKYMKENNIDVVVEKKFIVSANTTKDITDNILKILNKELKSLNLN